MPLVPVDELLRRVRLLVLLYVFDAEESWETSSWCTWSIMFWRSSILVSMVEKKLIIFDCCAAMCCSATTVSDTELSGLGLWPVWNSVSLCYLALGEPGAVNSCTFR